MKRFLFLAAVAAAAAPALISLGNERSEAEPPSWLQGEGALKGYQAARVYVDGGNSLDNGVLLVRDGKVASVVEAADVPPLVEVVDLGDVRILPGFVAADSPLTGNGNQGDLSMGAHRRAFDDFDPFLDMDKVLERGITTFYLSPDRRRLVGGRGAVVKSAGEQRILKEASDLRISLQSSAFYPPSYFRPPIPPTSENPIAPAQPQAPETRAGALMALRESAAQAKWGVTDVHSQALAGYLKGGGSLRVAADQEAEIRSALDLTKEWGTPLLLDGGSGAKSLAAALGNQRSQVIFHPPLFSSLVDLGPDWEPPAADALRSLVDAGVPVALSPGSYGRWTWLLESAAASIGYGLTEAEAIDGITAQAAAALGVADRVGSLRSGRDADFVVMAGDPLDPAASVSAVYINGDKVWDRAGNASARATASEASTADAPVVLRAGTLWTGEGAPLTGGVEVLLKNGRVVAAGKQVPHPAGARIIDGGADAHLTPGFIDARSTHGIGSRVNPKAVLGWLAGGSRHNESWQELARSGITTAVIGPSRVTDSGVIATPMKTSAAATDDAFVHGRQTVLIDARTNNVFDLKGKLQGKLGSGKRYFDKWEKYRADRTKWEGEQATKAEDERAAAEAELRKRLATGAAISAKPEEAADEEGGEEEVVEEEVKVVDPLNGLWEGTIEDERLPEAVEVHARLFHEGAEVKGIFSSPVAPGESAELDGTWDAENLIVRFEIEEQGISIVIEGTIDADDHMAVNVEVPGMGSAEFEMLRTEVDEGPVKSERKRTKKDAGPQPPSINGDMEGMRALYEGRAVALVYADTVEQMTIAMDVFGAAKMPMQFVGGRDAADIADVLRSKNIGVVVSSSLVQRIDGADVVPAAVLQENGVAVAFQSATSGRRAAMLPNALAMAARFGLGTEQILHGLTAGAADLLGIGHRVGRLAPGMDGDVVLHDGPPFDLNTRVTNVFVNGVEVPQK